MAQISTKHVQDTKSKRKNRATQVTNAAKRCHLHCVNGKTGFVYTVPGRHEEKAERPVYGATGTNLNYGLAFLHDLCPEIFHSIDRYDYDITNVQEEPEYKAKTGRSLPTKAEVLDPKMLRRLHNEVKHLQYVVVCGKLTEIAFREMINLYGFNGKVAYVAHTSRQGLGCPKREHYPQAMRKWADEVVTQLT